MPLARSALLAIAVMGAGVTGAAAQTAAIAFDAVYETPRPVYAAPLALYGTPEITLAAPVSFAVGEPGLGQGPPLHKRGFIAPAYYGEVVSRGIYPSLTASRCVTDLGYGRWEACD